ncbi:MAG TPA: helix-turn-helix domain-containing protein, partial [Vicinamibacteria bacterium]
KTLDPEALPAAAEPVEKEPVVEAPRAPVRTETLEAARRASSRLETLDLNELEKRAIQQALEETGGNLSQVVRLLGIGRTTLYRKLKTHGLRG